MVHLIVFKPDVASGVRLLHVLVVSGPVIRGAIVEHEAVQVGADKHNYTQEATLATDIILAPAVNKCQGIPIYIIKR